MILVLINEHDNGEAATAFAAIARAVVSADDERRAFDQHAGDLGPWGISRLPCVAKIHDGIAVHQVSTVEGLATFESDALAAVEAYEAAREAP